MALIKCGECSAEISDQAASCPRCGLPRAATPLASPPQPAASTDVAAGGTANKSIAHTKNGGSVAAVVIGIVLFLLLGGGGIIAYILNRAQSVVTPFAGQYAPSPSYAPPPLFVPQPPPPQEVFSETIQLREGNARSFEFTLSRAIRVQVAVQAQPRAVDVMLMTEAEWERFRRVTENLFGGRYTYRQALSRPGVIGMDESEVLPEGRWAVVVQLPSHSLLGGGVTNASVRVLLHPDR